MLVKNLTPFFYGTTVTSRQPPQPEMSLAVRATFRLSPGSELEVVEGIDQGFMSSEAFADSDDDRAGACSSPDDFADWKPHADLLLHGSCHVPGGRPTPVCKVCFAVGSWHKEVLVFGDRIWGSGFVRRQMAEPMSFVSMPLTWERSFGGHGFDQNPVGRGIRSDELPNLELPGEEIRSPRDRPRPAALGPVSSAWAPRAGKVGRKYGGRYRKERAPFYSEDFDWTFFQAAPADQQLRHYLRGDEEVSFTNLHPEADHFSVHLPGIRIRAFVKDIKGRCREVPMSLDTLFADVDGGQLFLTWRGLDPVLTDDLSDVATMLIASEELSEPEASKEHYVGLLEKFEGDPLGFDDLPEEQKEGFRLAKALAAGSSPAEAMGVDAPDDESSALDEATKLVLAEIDKAGMPLPPDKRRQVIRLLEESAAFSKKNGVDLAQKFKEKIGKRSPDLPAPVMSPGAMPKIPLKERLGVLQEMTEKAKAAAQEAGVDLSKFAAFDAFLADARLKQLDPSYRAPGEEEPTLEEPGPEADLRWRDFRGMDLSDRDLHGARFEGCNLSGVDLSRSSLRGATFENANLQGARIEGADLTGAHLSFSILNDVEGRGALLREIRMEQATFTGARLQDADLAGADLSMAIGDGANLCGSDLSGARMVGSSLQGIAAVGANFTGALLERAILKDADLSDAVLDRIDAYLSVWSEANLSRVACTGARIRDSLFHKTLLEGVRIRDAVVTGSMFLEARGSGLDVEGVELTRTSFMKADLTKARFVRARGKGVGFNGADLTEADFAHARFPRSFFLEANLTRTRFWRARLSGARFDKCRAEGIEMVEADLRSAEFSRATIKASRFTRANLYDAKFYKAEVEVCDFEEANLKRALLEQS